MNAEALSKSNGVLANNTLIFYLSKLILSFSFLLVFYYFKVVDVYHVDFDGTGHQLFIYNVCRLFYAILLILVVRSAGILLHKLFNLEYSSDSDLTSVDRFVVEFAAGFGLLQLILFVLGLCGLYYTSVMFVLFLSLLFMSPFKQPDFTYSDHIRRISPRNISKTINLSVCAFGLFLVVIIRGLYPGGGHDYYTHYFYYYLAVLKNHGLKPNDVWYHFYYSKGDGLQFMSMLLTDPLAPTIVSLSCFVMGVVSLYAFADKLMQKSLWPFLIISLFMIYSLASLNGEGGGFEKTHEQLSALIIVLLYSLFLINKSVLRNDWLVTLVSSSSILVGTVILNQSIGVLLAITFTVVALLERLLRNYKSSLLFLILTITASTAVFSILCVNYLMTGLLSDQMIDKMMPFADFKRLGEWGVIPNVLLVAWIRDNYNSLVLPWNMDEAITQFICYARLNFFSFSLMSVAVAWLIIIRNFSMRRLAAALGNKSFVFIHVVLTVVLAAVLFHLPDMLSDNEQTQLLALKKNQKIVFNYLLLIVALAIILQTSSKLKSKVLIWCNDSITLSSTLKYALLLFVIFATLACLSTIFGRSQVASYYRFSSFMLPIWLMFTVITWSVVVNLVSFSVCDRFIFRHIVPLLLLAGSLYAWHGVKEKIHSLYVVRASFASGSKSIAEAYQSQSGGMSFGGIHQGTRLAMQHVPKGDRVWSTTVVSHCMVPDCIVESIISYKLSSKMNEIINGNPEYAEKILKEEGLNYFLYLSEYPLLDILPYSGLFSPKNMQDYFTVKWTDGKTYLLSWRGPNDKPLTEGFVSKYNASYDSKEDPSFKFSAAKNHLAAFMKEVQGSGYVGLSLPWKRKS